MNGIHDMGGMDGFGPVEREENEPVFHHHWEGRVYALNRAVRRWGRGRDWPGFRFVLENISPADYLRMSYYERWFHMIVNWLSGSGLVSEHELASGRPDAGVRTPEILPRADTSSLGFGRLDVAVAARFRPNDRVRARNLHPVAHNRQPRYVRGRVGTVVEDYGVYALQDSDGVGRQPCDLPQHVYSVRFEARELWGDRAAARDAVYVDLWEEYLEAV
ncbi:MAG: nitrile hydratase subunit beta [Gemmatimonadota bacterium]|nr:nitrile hydratase subunit beta [Gemmatimonadota bacterium]